MHTSVCDGCTCVSCMRARVCRDLNGWFPGACRWMHNVRTHCGLPASVIFCGVSVPEGCEGSVINVEETIVQRFRSEWCSTRSSGTMVVALFRSLIEQHSDSAIGLREEDFEI